MKKIKKIFTGVYKLDNYLLTKNSVPGKRTYGEELIKIDDNEYREWNPFRSKLAAGIKNGLKEVPIEEGSKILYLGSAEGTTISHISDIIGKKGLIFGVDISAKVMQKFLYICETRENIVPMIGDAEQPHSYRNNLAGFSIDLLYQDVSQRNQAEIFLKNSRMYLKRNGYGLLAIKARSISAKENTKDIIRQEISKLKKEFKVVQTLDLKPFDKDHALVLCKKK